MREAFSELSEYDDERIAFRAPIGRYGASVRLMDGIWHELFETKPWCINVEVKDGPGDQAASKSTRLRLAASLHHHQAD